MTSIECFQFSNKLGKTVTARKVSKCGVFLGPCFPVFELNTEIYSVNLRIQSKYGKAQTRKNYVFGHFTQCILYGIEFN